MNCLVPFTFEFTTLPLYGTLLKLESDVFPSVGKPNTNITTLSLNQYIKLILDDYEGMQEYMEEVAHTDELSKKLNTVINSNVKCLYVMISYPLSNPAVVKFTCEQSITYGLILFLTTAAYQIVYHTEEQDDCDPGYISPNCLNRETSHGRFGIWGHVIGDLVYNGNSEIKIYNDYLICELDCDS